MDDTILSLFHSRDTSPRRSDLIFRGPVKHYYVTSGRVSCQKDVPRKSEPKRTFFIVYIDDEAVKLLRYGIMSISIYSYI